MKVFILSVYTTGEDDVYGFPSRWLRKIAQEDRYGEHQVVTSPSEADIILFMESHPFDDTYCQKVLTHPLRKQFGDKCFLYHDGDSAFPFMQGIYPSIKRKHYNSSLCRAGVYLGRLTPNDAIRLLPFQDEPEFLFSFLGASYCPVRKNIMTFQYPHCFLKDTCGLQAWKMTSEDKAQYEAEFIDVSRKSTFILCPAGYGPTSYRLYEAMEMGRCPVVLSDEWVRPPFIPWDEFTLQLPETEWALIPELLEANRDKAKELGMKARQAWEEFVSPTACFHWLIQSCLDISNSPKSNASYSSLYLRFARSDLFPEYIRHLLRLKRNHLKEKLKRG